MSRVAAIAERSVQICAVLLAVAFLGSGLVYLSLAYWNVTQQDYWRIYEICLNRTWLQSALLKFNGHSLFFPSFIWLADLRVFHGYQGLLFFVGLLLLLFSTSLLLVPIWRDTTVELTAKLLATLAVIVGSFWMGRAAITVSGGFNCMSSLVILGVASASLFLPKMGTGSPPLSRSSATVLCAGFVASFSFGTGLAIWPSLLLLGWCLRLPWRALGLIAAGGVIAALIFHSLPPPMPSHLVLGSSESPGLISLIAFGNLCKLVGSPLFYAAATWQGKKISSEVIQSGWLLWGGMAAVTLAAAVAIPRLIRRDLESNSLGFTGLILISFNLCALVLIVVGRVNYFPDEAVAPRYLFWSSLFWAGLLTAGLHHAARTRWLRWPIFLVALVFAAGAWASHREEGVRRRGARLLADEGATGLINGVIDPKRMLFRNAKQIQVLLPQLRAQRLDMFTEGLQDWIGQPVSKLFVGPGDRNTFRGYAAIERLLQSESNTNAVRVTGRILVKEKKIPPTMVIVDPQGFVAGIARSAATNGLLNRWFYGGRLKNGRLAGYIGNYNPAFQYVIRSASGKGISEEQIQVAALPP